ncbi:MAG: coproporphyrinogen III oxidase [candidate division BRC1 bacterium ADurb.BinA292]|nr:MAG: coproporphyrinogen III oxidase [candidate division BRC1 bacterium ADurb.BinA292]
MFARRFQRALLINPPTGLYRRDDRCQCKVEDQTVQIIFPPVELATLAATLRRGGAEVELRDYPAQSAGWEDYIEDLRRLRPDMVLVNVVTATSEGDFDALRAAKETLGADNVLTIAKGEYMEALGESVLRHRPEVDFGFHGEIDLVLDQLYKGEPLETIDGLIWRRAPANGHPADVVRNPGHPLIEELDALPFPARDLLRNDLYRSPETNRPLTVIHGNRGCPAKCIFCPAGVMSGYRIRYRSPGNIMAEIDDCVRTYGIREFLFHGDTFTINKKWLIELCDLIIASGHKIRWGCNSRVDTIDDERAAKMRQAGCWVVAFGVESGNQEILDYMKKGQKAERAFKAAEVCRRHGLRVHTFFVIGTPLETRATLRETYEYARKIDPDFFDFNIAYPLPGTELYEIAEREGLFEKPPDATGYANAAVRTRELSSRDLTEWRRKALLSMYLRPRYIARMLYRAGSPRVALNYVRAGARRFRQLISPAPDS